MVWATGKQLQGGKYVIQGVLGQGGFGITYKAWHVSLNHYVVIKTPNEYLQYEPDYNKYLVRFIEEAQILARLSRDPHPSIVGVHDLFQEGIISCLVMNFVEGENLFELVRRRRAIPEAEAVRYIRQIGEALTLVHQVGLTHQDAHPGNILLRQNGRAVLIDFGIAKELVPSTYTSTGAVGNEGFAPYEQVHRGSREPNVDVYCLAATLYYALPPIVLKIKIVPWVNLLVIAGYYLVIGFLLVEGGVWGVVVAGAGAGFFAVSFAVTLFEPTVAGDVVLISMILAGAFAVTWALDLAGFLPVLSVLGEDAVLSVRSYGSFVVGLAVRFAGFFAVSLAGIELEESFSKFHTFLILLGTSWLGLGLGWLLGSIF
ncbi:MULTISPECIES: serine/threonine protein kinase [unclassified Coleofasciculus]|uniref:serine/threonine protein kinase n=1 Tax=unclassified Coleofasciculus TaxID=2692782 RepID=UPI001880BE6E|nr:MULTISPECIES: serine/threonine-protein kinase [unclassified Coleofasciculus]MBE9126443.1 serine/threonine protein kinase [Coleofasciculus sp. LEGE 07081]MBE9148045.1 serine/threonine protein kinase [Coleofasciculus sp. LEGE 07092]